MLIGVFSIVFSSYACAEPYLSTVNEKYTIEKKVGWASWWPDSTNPTEITIIDSRNNTMQNHVNSTKNFDILISNFVAISKGKVSGANNTLLGDAIQITGKNITEKSEGVKAMNLTGNMTTFKINVTTDEEDTGTYSGKIFLKNESVLIPIPVEIVIQHDVEELLVTNIISIISALIAATVLIKCYCKIVNTIKYKITKDAEGNITRIKERWGKVKEVVTKKELEKCRGFEWTTNKPWISSMVIIAVGMPASVLVDTNLIGNNFLDVLIASSVGFLVLTKLLAREKKKEDPKDKISLEFIPGRIEDEKKEVWNQILERVQRFREI